MSGSLFASEGYILSPSTSSEGNLSDCCHHARCFAVVKYNVSFLTFGMPHWVAPMLLEVYEVSAIHPSFGSIFGFPLHFVGGVVDSSRPRKNGLKRSSPPHLFI